MAPTQTATQPDPDVFYLALDSFSSGERVVARGSRLRGDDPLVHRHLDLFYEDGTPVDEVVALQRPIGRGRSPEPG